MQTATRLAAAATLSLLLVASSHAQDAPARPKTYALVSAVGDQINYATQRMQTGTNLEGYRRATLKISDRSIDSAVLRGLDKVLGDREPSSQRVFLRLAAGQLDGVPPSDREKVALEKLRAELGPMPQRAQWDQIIIVTPYYRMSELRGLASKLHGVGIYVQGMDTNIDNVGGPITGGQLAVEGEETRLPDGKKGVRSSKYIAVYSYTQVWVLDARTLEVIKNEPWMFNEKIYDPKSSSLNTAKMLSPDQLAERFEAFTERAAGRALAQTFPRVEPGELKEVAPPARR